MKQQIQLSRYNFYGFKGELDENLLVDVPISILGQKLNNNLPCDKKKEQLKLVYSKTIWFTYRKNFPTIPNSNITSDAGWGCMLRSGQMIWAQILRCHLRQKHNIKNYQFHLLCAFVDDDGEEYKRLFMEEKLLSPYSILKIETASQIKYKQKPGQWYRPDGIIATIQNIHEHHPMKGSSDLKIVLTQNLLFDQLYCEMYGLQIDCEHIIEKVKQAGKQFVNKICDVCVKQEAKSLSLFVSNRLGLDEINKIYLDVLYELMDLPQFQGIIGGQKDRAYYIIGRMNRKLIFLDPHYVQESTSVATILNNVKTYFSNDIRYMESDELSPSINIGFYCKSLVELEDLFHKLEDIKIKYDPDQFFLYISRTTMNEMIVSDISQNIIEVDDSQF